MNALKTLVLTLALATLFSGCAGDAAHRQGVELIALGQDDAGLEKLAQSTREAPNNAVFRQAYRNAQQRSAAHLLALARQEVSAGRFDAAEALLNRALPLDVDPTEIRNSLTAVSRERQLATEIAQAKVAIDCNDLETAERTLKRILIENPGHLQARALLLSLPTQVESQRGFSPKLRKSFAKPATLEFHEANLSQVLEALSRHSGLNFILDKDVPNSLSVTLLLRDVSVAQALDVILTTQQLRQRVLNDNSLLIYPDTVAKQGEHQDLVVRNFFLANAESKQVAAMLKTVLKVKNVFADDKLNLLILRDTPAMIALAERLVATHDVAEPEVMLEVAVVEVTRSQLANLGIKWPAQLTLTPLAAANQALTLRDLRQLNSTRIGAGISPLIANLQDDSDSGNLLANPRIRTHNREKALIRIGDRVPIITTTATSTGFVSENVQYVDVGLKLEVEPTIYPNGEIAIKLALEVSSVVKEIVSKAGSVSYQIGGRNASTVLRLKDGETQVLGGLINDDDRRTASRLAGLGKLPVIGRLFSSENNNNQKTELVLSITPYIVRGLAPPANVPDQFWSGTENDPRVRELIAPEGPGDTQNSGKPERQSDHPVTAP